MNSVHPKATTIKVLSASINDFVNIFVSSFKQTVCWNNRSYILHLRLHM